jgi:hypothetical protein
VHRVGEVHAADAEVDDLHPGRQLPPRQTVRERDAEAVVAEEDVADPRDEDPRAGGAATPSSSGSTSSGAKKNR